MLQEKMAEPSQAEPVTYTDFFVLPVSCNSTKECKAKCKLCLEWTKYSMISKGSLLKHLQSAHARQLDEHKAKKREEKRKDSKYQSTFDSNGQLLKRKSAPKEFKNQDLILTSLVRNLVGSGGLSIQVAEQEWFRKFMSDVEPKFQPVSRVAVKKKLDLLYEEEKDQMLMEITNISLSNLQSHLTFG